MRDDFHGPAAPDRDSGRASLGGSVSFSVYDCDAVFLGFRISPVTGPGDAKGPHLCEASSPGLGNPSGQSDRNAGFPRPDSLIRPGGHNQIDAHCSRIGAKRYQPAYGIRPFSSKYDFSRPKTNSASIFQFEIGFHFCYRPVARIGKASGVAPAPKQTETVTPILLRRFA